MGRSTTGAYTTQQSRKIDLRWMLKNGYLKKNTNSKGTMSWTDGSTIAQTVIKKHLFVTLIRKQATICPNSTGVATVKVNARTASTPIWTGPQK